MWNYNRLNKHKEALCISAGITADREDEFREIGDDSPLFRYTSRYCVRAFSAPDLNLLYFQLYDIIITIRY